MPLAALLTLTAAFLFTAVRSAGVDPADWNITLLALSLLAILVLRRPQAPPLPRAIAWPLVLLPAWVLLQILPLPAALVRLLSPVSFSYTAALPPSLAPAATYHLSVFPAATLTAGLHLAGAVLVFLTVRELAWHYSDHSTPWTVAFPLIAIAALEAALGLLQYYTGAAPDGAHGTYASRDHFAGLIELALPFPVMYGFAALWRRRERYSSPLAPALVACASFAAAALLLLAAVHSLSRMGFLSALFALIVLGAAAVRRKLWLLAAPAAFLLLLVFLPPDQLIQRFATLSTAEKIAADDRLELMRETIPLVRAYPLTGCGLGAYESAFLPLKHKSPTATDAYAHNDYLQYLAELGLPGFTLGLTLVSAVLASALRTAAHASPSGRALALACVASLSALLLHSLADFNSYIPANTFAIAWVAALASPR